MTTTKKILTILLCAVLLLTFLPLSASAADTMKLDTVMAGTLQARVESKLDLAGQTPGNYDYAVVTALVLSGNCSLSNTTDTAFIRNYLTSLRALDLSDYIGTFPESVFSDCTSLETIVFPANIALSNDMFKGCAVLQEVLFRGVTAPTIGTNAFDKTTVIAYVPNAISGGYEFPTFKQNFTHVYTEVTSFTEHPSDVKRGGGGNGMVVTLEAAVNPESTAPNLQWQRSTDGGTTWKDIAEAKGLIYYLYNAGAWHNGQYRCVARNFAGEKVISNVGTVAIMVPNVKITGNPANLTIGETVRLWVDSGMARWSVTPTSLASIGTNGQLTAKNPGIVTVTVEPASGGKAACKITINAYVSMRIGKTIAIQNGKTTQIDNTYTETHPFKISGRTMIPIRFVGEKMGGKVSYTNDKAPIHVKYGDVTLELKIGQKTMKVTKGKTSRIVTLDVAATKRDARVYLPLRAVGEALGFDVKYQVVSGGEYIVVNNPKMSSGLLMERMGEARWSLG